MTILVTGSAGHLGEALKRTLRAESRWVRGIDIKPSAFTDMVGSISDRAFVRQAMSGISHVIHAATLHKPHVATHGNYDFLDTNIAGTLNLLEEAVAAGVASFVFTSTTSTFGAALTPAAGEPAAWVTEDVLPVAKNIYGVTKLAAEGLCELFARKSGLPVVILRTSRFFPENDDNPDIRNGYSAENAQPTSFFTAASISATWSAPICWRSKRRRQSALAATSSPPRRRFRQVISPRSGATRLTSSNDCSRVQAPFTHHAAGRCFLRSTVSMSTNAQGGNSAGSRDMISVSCSIACATTGSGEALWR